MRETLHQLTLTLALPVSVLAVWAVRGEPAKTAALEFATPYRVELGELPLPTRERLRAPGSPTTGQTPRAIAEEATPRAPRPLLARPPAPAAVDLPSKAGSGFGIAVAQDDLRAEYPHAPAAPRAALPAPHGALGQVSAASGIVSARATMEPQPAAPAVTATVDAAPPEPVVESDAGKPAATETGPAATERDFATAATARDFATAYRGGGVSGFDRKRGFAKPTRFEERPAGGDGKPRGRFGDGGGYPRLTPANPLVDPAMDLSLDPTSSLPTDSIVALPLAALDMPAEPASVDELEPEVSAPGPILRWQTVNWSPAVVIPEPGSALLLGAALAALGAVRRGRGAREPRSPASARATARCA